MSGNELDTTIDEWRVEMKRLIRDDPGKTITELIEEFKVCRSTMQIRMNKLVSERKCTRGVGIRADSNGYRRRVSVYQLTFPKTKAGKK